MRAINIHPSRMISEIGVVIGNTIGECISVEADEKGCCMGTYMRIRVQIGIAKPLRRIVKLTLDPKNPSVVILLLYERLPEFCYGCGLFGHQYKECSQYDDISGSQEVKLPYGSWLRAEDEKVKLPSVEIILNRNPQYKIFSEKSMEDNSLMLMDSIGQKRGFPNDKTIEVCAEIDMKEGQY